jgi:hypothetical protein
MKTFKNRITKTINTTLRVSRCYGARLLAAAFAISAHGAVVPPDAITAGKTTREWMADYFRWAMEIPDGPTHPLRDQTGEHAGRNQSGPVWFLGGVLNDTGIAVRDITVPDNVWLFVMMVGVECSTLEDPPFFGANEEELRACAESFRFSDHFFSIDGESTPNLERFYFSSPMFNFTMPSNNIFGVPGGGSGQAVGAGPAVILEPLSPGVHNLQFRVNLPDYFSAPSSITYRITVFARPAISIRVLSGTDHAELSWPTTSGFVLEESSSASPDATWTAASTVSTELINETEKAIVTMNPTGRFFRLRKL